MNDFRRYRILRADIQQADADIYKKVKESLPRIILNEQDGLNFLRNVLRAEILKKYGRNSKEVLNEYQRELRTRNVPSVVTGEFFHSVMNMNEETGDPSDSPEDLVRTAMRPVKSPLVRLSELAENRIMIVSTGRLREVTPEASFTDT